MLVDGKSNNIADLIVGKRKLLKCAYKSTNHSISVGIVGGYSVNDLADWLTIYSADYSINISVESVGWGSIRQVMNSVTDDFLQACDALIILPFYDNLACPPSPAEHLRDSDIFIRDCIEFYEKCLANNVTVIQCDYAIHPVSYVRQDQINEMTIALCESNNKLFSACKNYSNVKMCSHSELVSRVGSRQWYDRRNWASFGDQLSSLASIQFGKHLASTFGAIYSSPRKVLVLDLDNTLWGGIIGDDGKEGLKVGPDTPEGRPYYEFQQYVKILKKSGVVLAICSKNEFKTAKDGFSLPGMHLHWDDFSAVRIGWGAKSTYIEEIASELNLGLASIVFVDDNPVEREQVKKALPDVAVPDVGNNVIGFIDFLEERKYFYSSQSLTREDQIRIESYSQNKERDEAKINTKSESEFLKSLETQIHVHALNASNVERVVQLFNKTNQFNLTTARVLPGEIDRIKSNELVWCFEVRDKFGEYGIVAAIRCIVDDDEAEIINWVMSCRIFNRRVEYVIFNWLVVHLKQFGIKKIRARYLPTERNAVIRDLLPSLGFLTALYDDGSMCMKLEVANYLLSNDNHCEVVYCE